MADVSAGMKCIKVLLFVFNIVFILLAIALVACGIVARVMLSDVGTALEDSSPTILAIFMILLGVVIFIVAFFGCCGAIKESRCMVLTYAVIMTGILVIELICAIVAFALRGKIEKVVRTKLSDAIHKNYNKTVVIQKAVDHIQEKFKCCGANNASDWTKVPKSCCKKKGCDTSKTKEIYSKGCVDKLKKALNRNILLIGGVALGICFVELLGIVFACCLARALKDAYQPV